MLGFLEGFYLQLYERGECLQLLDVPKKRQSNDFLDVLNDFNALAREFGKFGGVFKGSFRRFSFLRFLLKFLLGTVRLFAVGSTVAKTNQTLENLLTN